MTRSGANSSHSLRVSSCFSRTPRGSRGLASSAMTEASLMLQLILASCRAAAGGDMRARHPGPRRQIFVDIGGPQRIELRPQHRTFEFERLDRRVLLGTSLGT